MLTHVFTQLRFFSEYANTCSIIRLSVCDTSGSDFCWISVLLMKLISSLVSINKHICRYTFSHLLHDLLQVHSCSFVLSWFSWPSDFIMNKWYESISFACLMSPRLPEHPKNTTNLQLLTVLIQRSTQMITYNPQSAIDVRSVESLFFKCCFFSISFEKMMPKPQSAHIPRVQLCSQSLGWKQSERW